ncbi:MAG: hypothetical protein DLM62_15765 [Pseudonocardiales bacterium]|nr:MAG: hypothetical protein DLM62_15765 [Pseudonocardiales bacterium]
MPAVLSFVELDAQHVELLPARTVLSMFSTGDGGTAANGTDSTGGVDLGLLNHVYHLVPGMPGVDGANANG